MRIRGLFLGSRVARRTFWALVAAALLPLALFGLLAGQSLLDRMESDRRQSEGEYLKHIGLRAYDRLNAARATLAAVAADGNWGSPRNLGPDVGRLLKRLVTVDNEGRPVIGERELVDIWHRAGGAGDAGLRAGAARDLWWLPREAPGRPGPVLLEHLDAQGRGRWLAEVAPDFLWSDFGADGPAANLCLSDEHGARLRCPITPDADAPSWLLFMHAGFGSPDWVLSGRRTAATVELDDDTLRMAVAGAAATLLLIVTLGMVLVRRQMVPLEQLIAGVSRLARGDWSVRVEGSRPDEFGQLARAFNAMAGRIGWQMEAMDVQASIDREILGGLDLPQVMQRVLERLRELAPGATAALVTRRADGEGWRVHRLGIAPVEGIEVAAGDLAGTAGGPAPGTIDWADPPDWARRALGGTTPGSRLRGVPARWQDQLVAVLLFASPRPLALDEDAEREVATLRDRCAMAITAARRERRLVERAVRDELTGLLNRHGLHDACDERLRRAGGPAPFTLLFTDLDGFKEVNDALGHTAGDQLLCAVADRLRAVAPAGTALARPGGDEFVLLLPAESKAEPDVIASELCRRLGEPFTLRGQLVRVGASVGVAACPGDATERDELMRRADLAMYAAKADGRGRWRRYADALDAEASERAWIVADLRAALDRGELEVHYQARVDVRSGRACGAEALVRWPHPEHGMVSPARFIPVAEESDLIVALGRFVMDSALRERRVWRDQGVPVDRVAVNVSARQLRDPAFATDTLAMLEAHGLQPRDLEIEITESLFAGDPTVIERALAPLRERGVLVALDDFGTGYSSLAALSRLPVDVMKIDRAFVIGIGRDRGAEAVVRSVLALARDLGKRVVAEGVETLAQQQVLVALGCDELQGFRYAKPVPAAAFREGARAGFDGPLRAPAPAAVANVQAATTPA